MFSALRIPPDICPRSASGQYAVVLQTPRGAFLVELRSNLGPHAAIRRAHMSLVAARYGDLNEVTVVGCTTKEQEA